MINEIYKALTFAQEVLKYPDVVVLESATGPVVKIKGQEVILFGSYNYLGLANNESVKSKAIEILNKYGVGSGGVRILTGTMDIHEILEKKVSKLIGKDATLTIPSGYGTNTGVIPGIVNLLGFGNFLQARKAVIFNDEYNHASIVDGSKLTDAVIVKYRHCDPDDLESKIRTYKSYRKLIITDGVFSMDGDVAPLKEIISLAQQYDAVTMVDDAHGFGALGTKGSGTAESLGLRGKIDINMGTFSKGIGVSGGFVSGEKRIIDLLKVSTRSYMFSDSISPMVVGAVIGALDFIEQHPDIINDLKEKADYFRSKVQDLGLSTLNSSTHIIPLYTGDSEKTIKFSRSLLEKKVFAPPVRWPAVPKELGRIRFAVSAPHTYEQIDKVVEAVKDISEKLEIPKLEIPTNND